MILSMYIIEDALSVYEITTKLINSTKFFLGIRLGKDSENENYAAIYTEKDTIVCSYGGDEICIALATVEQVYNSINNYVEKFQVWEKSLWETLCRNGSLQDLVTLSIPIFNNPIFIVDELDLVCARTSHEAGTVNEEWDYIIKNGRMPFETLSNIYQNKEFNNRLYDNPVDRNIPFLFSPPGMYHRGINFRIPLPTDPNKFLGTMIIVENETPITVGMLHISRILADALCEWVKMHLDDHKLNTTNNLFSELLAGKEISLDNMYLQKFLPEYGKSSYVLAIISPQDNIRLNHIITFTESSIEGSLYFIYEEELLFICPTMENSTILLDVFTSIARYNKVHIGISYPFTDLRALKSCYQQAQIALLSRNKPVNILDTQGVMEYLASEVTHILHGTDICHPALGLLKRYDDKHGTEYFKTLYVYLQKERSLLESAKALNIHRNSLIYRVERIKNLIQENLDDPDVREYILLSFRISSNIFPLS